MRKRNVVALMSVGAALAIAAGGTAIASSTWFVPKTPVSLRVKSVKMPPGVSPSASPRDGNAVVSWSAQEIGPGVLMQQYIVTAHDATKTNPLADVVHTVTASGGNSESVAFTAAELTGGKWQFGVTPRFELWTGEESKLSQDRINVLAAKTPRVPAAAALSATAAVDPTPTSGSTTEAPVKKPETGPTTPAADKDPAPEKSGTPEAGPTSSEIPSAIDPSPAGSAAE
ncbi:MAG TPA: hypothetical protein VGD29_06775 [Actinoplanes sp.]|jgi:hypothetical protein